MKIKKRGVIIPDQHFPIHDERAVEVVLKCIEKINPDIMINLGDVLENSGCSPWKYKRRSTPPLEYVIEEIDKDIDAGNKGLDLFDEVFKGETKYMLAGNHDEWLDFFVEAHPYMKDYTFRKALKINERGYKYYPFNHPLKIGKLNFIHGAYATVYHAKKHLEAYGANICYGHTHDVQRHTLTKLDSGTIGAWSMGCLKDMSRDQNRWLRGRLHNWQHAFGIVDWFSNGNFKIEVVEIIKGVTSLWGEIIEA